jgi:hypothetical protein
LENPNILDEIQVFSMKKCEEINEKWENVKAKTA